MYYSKNLCFLNGENVFIALDESELQANRCILMIKRRFIEENLCASKQAVLLICALLLIR